jgi:hypothetical protein
MQCRRLSQHGRITITDYLPRPSDGTVGLLNRSVLRLFTLHSSGPIREQFNFGF